MRRRSDNLDTVLLALELLRRIPRSHSVTARTLRDALAGEGLDRDLRTIQRHLDALSRQFDIERDDRSRPYGYRWKPAAPGLSVPAMTPKEALLLTLAEQQLRPLLPAKVMKSMGPYFDQARRSLAPGGRGDLERQWLGKVRVVATSQPLLPPTIRPGVLEAVSEALFLNRWLQVDYRNAEGKRGVADVMPLGLAQQGPALYLVCRYRGFDNERNLALHRMLSAELRPETFERPAEFDLERYDGEGRFGFGDGRRVKLRFDITEGAGHHLLEMKLSEDQVVKKTKGGYRVTATVVDTVWLRKWLDGFGPSIQGLKVQFA